MMVMNGTPTPTTTTITTAQCFAAPTPSTILGVDTISVIKPSCYARLREFVEEYGIDLPSYTFTIQPDGQCCVVGKLWDIRVQRTDHILANAYESVNLKFYELLNALLDAPATWIMLPTQTELCTDIISQLKEACQRYKFPKPKFRVDEKSVNGIQRCFYEAHCWVGMIGRSGFSTNRKNALDLASSFMLKFISVSMEQGRSQEQGNEINEVHSEDRA